MTPAPFGWILCVALAVPSAHVAAPVRLDDSASPRSHVPAQLVLAENGRPLADAPFARAAQVRFGRVDYKLATAAYVGRQARIWYVLPPGMPGLRSPHGLRIDWRSPSGRFASGSAMPGDRRIVWSGQVTEPWMSESLELVAQVDLGQLRLPRDGRFAFEAFFEIEVLP